MGKRKPKVVVAMSGGVDSSVTAALLVEQGYDVHGVSLRMWEGTFGPRVCSDHRGAKDVADHLGIRHELLDLRTQFVETVVKPFARDYLRGRTPNPCVACNRDFKLGTLLGWAKQKNADYVATGHYARIVRAGETGQASLLRGVDQAKDQSYFLFALSQDQLAHTIFPLGEMRKDDVREKARHLGLAVADRPDSQDICLGDYKAMVKAHAGDDELGGDIIDRAGNVLGRHDGIHGLTIGQRRGLGIAAPHPLYVLEIDQELKRVVVGGKDELACLGLVCERIHWIEPPAGEQIEAQVQIRYRSPAVPCTVRMNGKETCEIRFTAAYPAVTPGQAAVLYQGEKLLGGGWIRSAIQDEEKKYASSGDCRPHQGR
jgi:tRNA-specific 2-thiouridylase